MKYASTSTTVTPTPFPCGGGVINSTDVPKNIPDNDPNGVTSVLTVPGGTGALTDLDLVGLNITHTFIGDVRVSLRSPAGMTVILINQVCGGVATRTLNPGDQLPTVRQLAVDLAINPNTVARAYRELEFAGLVETHQGTGTFIGTQKVRAGDAERERQLHQIVADCVSRAGALGFTTEDLIGQLRELVSELARGR